MGRTIKRSNQGLALNAAATINKTLSAKERDNLDDSDFVFPKTRAYPIQDANHARVALSMVAKNGSDSEKAAVRKAVAKKYPDIGGDEETPANNSELTINEDEEVDTDEHLISQNHWEKITFNVGPSIRHQLLDGKQYSVCPMVMITEGVHAGSNGPLYYPAEELAKTPAVWNHKPIVVYHPTMNGEAISACEPTVISRRKVGMIFNTKYVSGRAGQPGKLKAEAWLEMDRLGKVDPRVAEAVQNGAMMEVSTGLFTDNEPTTGAWKTKPYSYIARNYRPDHLAILPDEKGACSIKDGAGLMRNAQMSHDELRDKLRTAITKKTTGLPKLPGSGDLSNPYVQDVFGTFAVYSHQNQLYSQGYAIDDPGNVSLKGAPAKVTRKQTYVDSTGATLNTEGERNMPRMTKSVLDQEQMIDALITNEEFGEDDRDALRELSLDGVGKIAVNAGIVHKDGQDYIDSQGDDNGETVKDGAGQVAPKKMGSKSGATKNKGNGKKKPEAEDEAEGGGADAAGAQPNGSGVRNQAMTLNEYIENAPEELRDVLSSGVRQLQQTKQQLVKSITANKANRFAEKYLLTKNVEELQAIAALAAPAKPSQRESAFIGNNFLGLGEVNDQPQEDAEVEPLSRPTFNFKQAREELSKN
jgi:hypothetical protein